MKFFFALLIVVSILMGLAMNNRSALGDRIAENIFKLREGEAYAGSGVRASLRSDDFASAIQVKKIITLNGKIPDYCEQAKSVWDDNKKPLLKMQFASDEAIRNAWNKAQRFCLDMPSSF